jgi:ABC-type Fe3+/spermidine/putrescine transport system ATPase subunit
MGLFPHLNVFENIAFGLRVKRTPPARIRRQVEEMLEVVSLTGFETRDVTSLSGGQQQRVAIARALVNEPAVLLLDEPLAALDLKLQLRLQRELRRIQRHTGITFVYVTHNQTEALSLSDRLAVMSGGRIEQIGTPAEMYLAPATSFVASFIGRTNLLEARIARRHGTHALAEVGELRFEIAAGPEMQPGTAVTLSLRPERIALSGAGGEAAGSCAATVSEVEFLGADTLYRMRLDDGRILLVQTLASAAPLARGSHVALAWEADAAMPIRATSISGDCE